VSVTALNPAKTALNGRPIEMPFGGREIREGPRTFC